MKKSKVRTIIGMLMMVTMIASLLTGCGSKPAAPAEQKPAQSTPAPTQAAAKKLVIGASFVAKDNQWWATTGKFIEDLAAKEGVELVLLWANGNQEKQIKDVEDLIQRKVDVIILGPVQQAGSTVAVDTAHKSGIPVVTIARLSDSKNVTSAVYFNEAQFGINQLDQIAKDFPNGANIVYLFGPVGAGYAIQQHEAFTKRMAEKYPNIKILQKYDSPTDTSAEGMKNSEDALIKYNNVDVICATNDDLALGAVRAVEAAGKVGKVKVYGCSALPMGMQAIYDGKMQFTNLKSQANIASKTLETAIKIAKKEQVGKTTLLEPVIITKENVTQVKDPMFGGTILEPKVFEPKK